MRLVRRSAPVVMRAAMVAGAVALLASGCSLFDRGDGTSSVSVFDVEAGDCFVTPQDITVELTSLPRVDCTQPHQQEAYALVDYVDPGTGTAPDTFPGDAALKSFADGACAEAFSDYVGVDYRDSRLYFTYLVPSARSWEQDEDRTTICFVTTTGEALTRSVHGTQW